MAKNLNGVDPSLAYIMSRSGLEDGDESDDIINMAQVPVRSVDLSPSQTTMRLEHVVGIAMEMLEFGGGKGEPLGAIVSSDGFIMDGHHRWAASILARGTGASVVVWKAGINGENLVRVLNILTKGLFGVGKGNTGSASIKDLNPNKVMSQLISYYLYGRKVQGGFKFTPEKFKQIMEKNFGSVEEGMAHISRNSLLIKKSVPGWAPPREGMPVINVSQVPEVAEGLNGGKVDWSYPYSDMARRVARRYAFSR